MGMKPIHKVAVVADGYLLAFLLALAAVALHTAITGESDARASDGMSAFGDLVLFGAVFAAREFSSSFRGRRSPTGLRIQGLPRGGNRAPVRSVRPDIGHRRSR